MNQQRKGHRCVIVGGGFAGLEAALYLKARLGEQADVTIVSASDRFTYRPFLTYIPFGMSPERIGVDLDGISRANGFRLVMGHVDAVDPLQNVVHFGAQSLEFDSLILATGARVVHGAVPRMPQGYTVWDEREMLRLRGRLASILKAAARGERHRIVFMIPPDAAWTGPVYELALMLATWLNWQNAREQVEIGLYTSETRHLEALGVDLHDRIASGLLEHGIEATTACSPRRVEQGRVTFSDATSVDFDVLISAAVYMGAGPTQGLEVDERGFLRTRMETRQLIAHDHVYAVGDGSDYPVKQGFLGLLQADAAAEHVASRILETEPAFQFSAGLFWVMEELDEVLVAHSDAESVDLKTLPSGRMRRLEAMAYMPRHQRLGNPLYSGLLWKGTEIGLKMVQHLQHADPAPHSNGDRKATGESREDGTSVGCR